MEGPSLYCLLAELLLLCLEFVFSVAERVLIPVLFFVVAVTWRYSSEVVGFVSDAVAIALDIADIVASLFQNGDTHSPWSSFTTTGTIIQVLSLVCFMAFLGVLSACRSPQPTRQSLEDLLDETVQKFRVTEATLRNWQSFGEQVHASCNELRKQNEVLQLEKAQLIAEKDGKAKGFAESAEKIEDLTINLEEARTRNRDYEQHLHTGRLSLKRVRQRADKWEQACQAAEDEVSKLTEEVVAATKRASTAPTETEQSRARPDHTDCMTKAASLTDQVDAQQATIRLQREDLAKKEKKARELLQLAASYKKTIDQKQAKINEQYESLTSYASLVSQSQASIAAWEEAGATNNASPQQEANTLESTRSLAAKDAELEEAQTAIQGLEDSLTARGISLQQSQARIQELEESLATMEQACQQSHAHAQGLEKSLNAKDRTLQQNQAEIRNLKGSLVAKDGCLRDAEVKRQNLNGQIASLTMHVNDRQAKFEQATKELEEKDASLRDSQEKVMNLEERVEELTEAAGEASGEAAGETAGEGAGEGAAGEAAGPETAAASSDTVTVENQRREIERLNGEVSALRAAENSREAERQDAMANAMAVDDPVLDSQTLEIATLQETIKQLRAALEGAQTELNAAKPDGEEMEVEGH